MSEPLIDYPCPACGVIANLTTGCPGCGRAPDPAAAEVIRLDREIATLVGRVEQARQAYHGLTTALRLAQLRRNDLAARVRASRAVSPNQGGPRPFPPGLLPPGAPLPPGPGVLLPAATAPARRPEASARTVQNLLFIFGGLLLGTAAIVFTAVAWATFGNTGRAVILAAVTLLALAVPPVAVRRGLTATAETFASVGLLLVLLDGYAAWAVNLFGVAGWPGARYAALVTATSAVVAAGYGRVTRLAAPWYAAVVASQPVLPLLAADRGLLSFGWALVFSLLAALNLAVLWRLRAGATTSQPRQIVAWLAYGGALTYATICGAWALLTASGPAPAAAGVPLVVAAALLVAAAVLTRLETFQSLAAMAFVLVLAPAVFRAVAEWRSVRLLSGAVIVTLLAAGIVAGARRLPARVRVGPRVGGSLLGGLLAAVVGAMAFSVAAATALRSMPPWQAPLDETAIPFDWQLPVAVVLAAVTLVLLLPRPVREPVVVVAIVLTVWSLPAVVTPPWWVTAAIGWGVATVLLLAAARPWPAVTGPTPRAVALLIRAGAGLALIGQALLVSLARPTSAAVILAAVMMSGLTAAAVTRNAADPIRRAIGGSALAGGLLAGPAALTIGLFAWGVTPWWQARAALGATALLLPVLVAVRRWAPAFLPYAGTALAVAALVTGVAPDLARLTEPPVSYASLGVLVIVAALALVRRPDPAGAMRSDVTAVILLVAVAPLLLRLLPAVLRAGIVVLVVPYAWLGEIWSGRPIGVGLTPYAAWPISAPVAAAWGVLAVAAGLAGWAWRRTAPAATLFALPVAVVAGLAGLVAAAAPWPAVPAVALGVGLAALLSVALLPQGAAAPGRRGVVLVGVPLGVALTGVGLAGALPLRASTLVALGAAVVAGTTAGVAGRTRTARIAGWLAGVVGAGLLAVTAALAGDLPLRGAAFALLGVSAGALALGVALRARRRWESVAVETVAQTGAVIALLLTFGHLRHAAAICTFWGVALGIRALRPGEPGRRRWVFAGVAAASELFAGWLLLAAGKVAVLEAYTLPAAGLALGAGVLALRARPGLNSWVAYGPGLVAALLPSLVSVLVAGGQPGRRLALGAAALAVVLVGARWQRQAPVLLGGGTLVMLTLRELVGVWELLPRWIFLGAGGLLLIGLAVTYERRSREVSRLRDALSRMS